MKVKNDFITNSSSTSFIFLLKSDNINDLYKHLQKYDTLFLLLGDEESIVCDDLINEIKKLKKINTKKIKSFLGDVKLSINGVEKIIKDSESQRYVVDWTYNLYEVIILKAVTERAIKDGFTHAIKIGFGDHEGDIQGVVGCIMDEYFPKTTFSKDLIILTINNH